MKANETRRNAWFAGLLLGFLAAPGFAETEAVVSDEPLMPESRHENIGELVTQFIQKSHYLHIPVDDDLSSLVMDRYIEALDRNRVYMLASDIEFFEKHRHHLDDVVRSAPLDPVFDMFSIYRTRVRERFEYSLTLLETEPDLTIDEEYQYDRSEAPWATTSEELDEIWRQRVKNDVLNLALNEKSWEKDEKATRSQTPA